jgi:pilus assembly protein CpaE
LLLRTSIGAFVIAQETTDAVEALREDRLFLRSEIRVEQGGVDAAVTFLSQYETPAVLIVETEARGEALFAQLEQLAGVCAPNTRVILIGRENDINLFRNLVREGISDYLVGPAQPEQLKTSFEDVFKDGGTASDGRVIAFTAVRGGAGSSALAQHTAFALSQIFEEQVILLDLDIPFGTAALAYNLQARQTIADALSQSDRMDEVLLERYLLAHDKHLSVLAAPASLGSGVTVTVDGLNALLKFVRRMASFVVLDLPRSWEPWVRDVLIEADELVAVAEPDLASLRDTKNMLEFIGSSRGNESPTHLVLNKVGVPKRPELSEKEFREGAAITAEVSVPSDPGAFGGAMNNGELVFKTSANSKVVPAINEIARMVSGRAGAPEPKKKGFSLFKK